MEDATKRLFHELSRMYGLIAFYAEQEIPAFGASRTRAHLQRLEGMINAMRDLVKAAEGARFETFDLADCVRLVVEDVAVQLAPDTEAFGPAPLVVRGNKALIDLVVTNALRNAVESSRAADSRAPVLVSWGETDVDVWISVIDEGLGLPAGFGKAFEIGTTSKRGTHFGMGLAIAASAARSLEGRVHLRSTDRGGVTFELRWPGLTGRAE